MKLKVLTYFNALLNAWSSQFQFDDHTDEQIIYSVAKACKARCVLGTYNDLRSLQLYQIGYFDDESGELIPEKKLLINLDTIIAEHESKASVKPAESEVKENVGESA